jgi:hypothetical protein
MNFVNQDGLFYNPTVAEIGYGNEGEIPENWQQQRIGAFDVTASSNFTIGNQYNVQPGMQIFSTERYA